MLMASGAGAFVKKTLAEVKTALGLGSAAYTASSDYAVTAKGVTNGDSHDHNGGDGGQVDHGGLAGLGDDDHTQYIKHSLATAANDFLVASGAGTFVKKTLAEVKTLLAETRSLQVVIDSGDAATALATGDWIDLYVEYACTILQWTLLAKPVTGQSTGSAVIDLWKDSYANFDPTIADTITASAKPTISSAINGQSSTLTGWTTTIPAGSVIRVNVDSCSNLRRISLSLKVQVA
jgi:hypothetical protein